ncbi:MAG TPA: neutral/alkaline non-lysosomal ceramidase N-terminal domain-containing protein, partial [Planctomycetota bacterium]|nr:neutral/alkaline non-lysosomal ceramidase N-terminal domain-containing protein [Planctomycetota bacterium]
MLKIGLARADITPRAGIEMSGFGKRIQPSLGVNDPLYATALVAADGETVIVAVDCDLLCVPADFTAEVRARAASLAGISASHVTVHCTHTHYGPRVP